MPNFHTLNNKKKTLTFQVTNFVILVFPPKEMFLFLLISCIHHRDSLHINKQKTLRAQLHNSP